MRKLTSDHQSRPPTSGSSLCPSLFGYPVRSGLPLLIPLHFWDPGAVATVGIVPRYPPGPPAPQSAPIRPPVRCAGTLPAPYPPLLWFPYLMPGTRVPTVRLPTRSDSQDRPQLPLVVWPGWGAVRDFRCIFSTRLLRPHIKDHCTNSASSFSPHTVPDPSKSTNLSSDHHPDHPLPPALVPLYDPTSKHSQSMDYHPRHPFLEFPVKRPPELPGIDRFCSRSVRMGGFLASGSFFSSPLPSSFAYLNSR